MKIHFCVWNNSMHAIRECSSGIGILRSVLFNRQKLYGLASQEEPFITNTTMSRMMNTNRCCYAALARTYIQQYDRTVNNTI